jgi:serine/threonine-protein kinase
LGLSPGTRLGGYEILSLIGSGGMGEVYRARDSRLNRDVAIKVLPSELAADPDRLARFEREAKVLASLNHPNIAQIHGVDDASGTPALVMELVEGPTLADRIAKGPIPLDEALPVAKQIAEALEAAHEQGIIHRDLKPANIKVRADGTVKVLDFGLAKALEPVVSAVGNATMSPTLSMHATQAGFILGTAAYMAPEQARGKAVDKRVDIWAFGCVLYEMVTGERLFQGEDLTETLASVVKEQPDLSKAPRQVQHLLRKCLEKDPKKRLRDLGDAWDLLDDASRQPAQPSVAPIGSWLPWAAVIAIAAAAIVASIVAYRATRPVERTLTRVADRLETDISPGIVSAAVAFSPDGSRLAYVSRGVDQVTHISMRRLDDAKIVVVPGTEGADAPFFSPDGRWIAFYAKPIVNPTLMKVSVDGGAAVPICPVQGARGGGYWAEDGSIYFSGQRTPILRVPESGGTPVPVTKLDTAKGEVSHRAPQLLPSGDAVLFESSTDNNTWVQATIEVQSLKSGERKRLVQGGFFGRYIHGADPFIGHLLYARDGAVFVAPMDVRRLTLTGPGVPVLNDVAGRTSNGIAHLAVTDSGTLAYVTGSLQDVFQSIFWWTSAGEVQPLQAPPGRYLSPRVSPDGSRLALTTPDASGFGLSVYESATTRMTTVSSVKGAATAGSVTWAPDSLHLAVIITEPVARKAGLYWTRSDGAAEPQLLVEGRIGSASVSPDGKRLIYSVRESRDRPADVSTVAFDLSDPDHPQVGVPQLLFTSPLFPGPSLSLSPDGRWVAYVSTESGRPEVYVRAPAKAGGRWLVSTRGGTNPVWSRAGHDLFYMEEGILQGGTQQSRIMAAPYTTTSDTFTPGQPREWASAQFPPPPLAAVPFFDISADGKRLVGVTSAPASGADGAQTTGVTFLFNFADELRRKAPSHR